MVKKQRRFRMNDLKRSSPLMNMKKWLMASVIILFALILAITGVCGW
jgi:hypothetical protein